MLFSPTLHIYFNYIANCSLRNIINNYSGQTHNEEQLESTNDKEGDVAQNL